MPRKNIEPLLPDEVIEKFGIIKTQQGKNPENREGIDVFTSGPSIRALDWEKGLVIFFSSSRGAKNYRKWRLQGDEIIVNAGEFEIYHESGKLNKSATIRKMKRAGMNINDIAKSLGLKYQHVYNVVKQDEELEKRFAEAEGSSDETTEEDL